MVGYRVCGDGDRDEDRDRDRLWWMSMRVRVRKRAIEPEEEESARARGSDVGYGDGASGIGVGTSVSQVVGTGPRAGIALSLCGGMERSRNGDRMCYKDWHPGMGMKLVVLGIGMRERKGSEWNRQGTGSAPNLAPECRYPYQYLISQIYD